MINKIKYSSLTLIIALCTGLFISCISTTTGISYKAAKESQMNKYEDQQDIVVAPPPDPLSSYDLPAFSVTTSDREPHILKLTVSLGYEKNSTLEKELETRNVQIQHIIHVILRGKSYRKLNSASGMIDLAEEIKAHVNSVLVSAKIKEVYFREFILN